MSTTVIMTREHRRLLAIERLAEEASAAHTRYHSSTLEAVMQDMTALLTHVRTHGSIDGWERPKSDERSHTAGKLETPCQVKHRSC